MKPYLLSPRRDTNRVPQTYPGEPPVDEEGRSSISAPAERAPGLQSQSYAEFVDAYALGREVAQVQRFDELDEEAFLTQVSRMLGGEFSKADVGRLKEHVLLLARILDGMAPLCARKARKMVKAGLIEMQQDGTGAVGPRLVRTKKESFVAKRLKRSRKIGTWVRRKTAQSGIDADSGAFNLQARGDVLTPGKHRNNYVVNGAVIAGRMTAGLTSHGDPVLQSLTGAFEIAALPSLVWHAATIDGVLLAKLSLVEQAQIKVLVNFGAAEKVLRSWMKGERPDPQLGLQALEFWSGVLAWPDSAAVMAAAIHQQRAVQRCEPQASHWMAERTAVRNRADVNQVKKGWVRDVPGAPVLGTTSICKAALYFMDNLGMLGAAGPIMVMAGMVDVSQGLDEYRWARVTKQQFRWRFDQLEKLADDAAKDPMHGAILLTAMLYCARKVDIADTEMTIALSRVLNGVLRAGSGAMSLTGMLLALGAGIAVGALGKASLAVAAVSAILFQALMSYRQHLRSQEALAQKEGERDGEALKATLDFEALCDKFLHGFTVTRGKGKFVNGDVGYSGVMETSYGPGGNEMLAWEIMAREVSEGFRDGRPLSFSMMMMMSLGLGSMDADQLEHGVLAKLHDGDEAGAVDAVEKVIRGLLAAPPARATEAVHPGAFKEVFKAAERMVEELEEFEWESDHETLAACLFDSTQDRGLGVDRQAFERSMKVLAQDVEKRGAEADVKGVYGRMLEFSRNLPPAKRETAAQRHLHTWVRAAERRRGSDPAGWTPLARSHARIRQLLELSTRQPDGPWTAQVAAVLDAQVASLPPKAQATVREQLKQKLRGDLHTLQAAGMLAGQVAMMAQELFAVLAPVGTMAATG